MTCTRQATRRRSRRSDVSTGLSDGSRRSSRPTNLWTFPCDASPLQHHRWKRLPQLASLVVPNGPRDPTGYAATGEHCSRTVVVMVAAIQLSLPEGSMALAEVTSDPGADYGECHRRPSVWHVALSSG